MILNWLWVLIGGLFVFGMALAILAGCGFFLYILFSSPEKFGAIDLCCVFFFTAVIATVVFSVAVYPWSNHSFIRKLRRLLK